MVVRVSLHMQDIDDIAFSVNKPPKLYAIANRGTSFGGLVEIDYLSPFTDDVSPGNTGAGSVVVKGAFPVADFEGLGFSGDGRLFSVTGRDASDATTRNRLWQLDTRDGTVYAGLVPKVMEYDSGLGDYEAVDCIIRAPKVDPETPVRATSVARCCWLIARVVLCPCSVGVDLLRRGADQRRRARHARAVDGHGAVRVSAADWRAEVKRAPECKLCVRAARPSTLLIGATSIVTPPNTVAIKRPSVSGVLATSSDDCTATTSVQVGETVRVRVVGTWRGVRTLLLTGALCAQRA